jgi:hypothetical protein
MSLVLANTLSIAPLRNLRRLVLVTVQNRPDLAWLLHLLLRVASSPNHIKEIILVCDVFERLDIWLQLDLILSSSQFPCLSTFKLVLLLRHGAVNPSQVGQQLAPRLCDEGIFVQVVQSPTF